MDTALLRIYNYLQRFAVGLEEIVLDQALFDGEFIQEFNEAEYKLKAVSQDVIIGSQLLERKYLLDSTNIEGGEGTVYMWCNRGRGTARVRLLVSHWPDIPSWNVRNIETSPALCSIQYIF